MNSAMLAIGSMSLYKSALVIALGAAACFALFYALYSAHGGFGAAAWLFTAADIPPAAMCSPASCRPRWRRRTWSSSPG